MLVGLHRARAGLYSAPITAGTPIGNMTEAGGLAAAFDGVQSKAAASCARLSAVTASYIGLTFSGQQRIYKLRYVGSNNSGVVAAIDPNVTVTFYAKTGAAPASGTDGTNLGSLTFADTTNENENVLTRIREVISSQPATLWDHAWAYVTHDGAANAIYCAQLRLFEYA